MWGSVRKREYAEFPGKLDPQTLSSLTPVLNLCLPLYTIQHLTLTLLLVKQNYGVNPAPPKSIAKAPFNLPD